MQLEKMTVDNGVSAVLQVAAKTCHMQQHGLLRGTIECGKRSQGAATVQR